MKLIRKYKKHISAFFVLNFLFELGAINSAFAVTGHSSMPEYRSFEPVATTNMVNMFSGGFSYNIPLLEVPNGYPINLSYSSGDVSNEAQSSWAGLGWTVNPGAINRMKRGLPDDYKGAPVTYHSRMPKNWTVSGGGGIDVEILDFELNSGDEVSLLRAGVNASVSFNNYSGVTTSVGAGITGVASLNFEATNGRFGWNGGINPAQIIASAIKVKDRKKQPTEATNSDEDAEKSNEKSEASETNDAVVEQSRSEKTKTDLNNAFSSQFSIAGAGKSLAGSIYSSLMPLDAPYPVSVTSYKGNMRKFKYDVGIHTLPVKLAPQAQITGSYVEQVYDDGALTPKNVYGYLYNEEALADENAIMDYYTENEKMYEKREVMIGMPQANYDNFNLSGEAMGGSFRAYRTDYGHYRKNVAKSGMNTFRLGLEKDLPNPVVATYSEGANLGYDRQDLKVSGWDNEKIQEGNNFAFRTAAAHASNENSFYAFSGDKAADFAFTPLADDKLAVGAKSKGNGLKATLDIDENHYNRKLDKRVVRGSYIGQSSIGDFRLASMVNGVRYKVYEKNLHVFNAAGTTSSPYNYELSTYDENAIGEMYTFNGDGVGYVYGLPLHTQNEKQIQYELGSSNIGADETQGGLIATVPAHSNLDENAKRKTGYEANQAYGTQFLLTQIVSPDYVDVKMDGPTTDDFGDYTQFNYKAMAGAQAGGNWYSYKTPYEGLSYSYGSLSSNRDEMGSMQYGEKELYYLHSVVSKTHAALFYTENRADGAELNVATGANLNEICEATGSGVNKLQKLTKIELYSLDDLDDNLQVVGNAKPIKTVHFEYDYSLCVGTPNATQGGGKLTLKKVWFEYEGKKTSKISPYEFDYTYPTQGVSAYPAKYASFQDAFGDNPYLSASGGNDPQNPMYSPLNNDRWGAYRNYEDYQAHFLSDHATGEPGDLARFFPFIDQKPEESFDPAAWHLKRIELPSGGEIHVQYEQNDYTKVQDKDAMVMVPLDASGGKTPYGDEGDKNKKYYLALEKVMRENEAGMEWGAATWGALGNEEKRKLADRLFSAFNKVEESGLQKGERMYFNFLYALIGNERPDYTTINSEYIEGYARIHGYGFDAKGVYFTFKSDLEKDEHIADHTYYKKIKYDSKFSKREFPRKVCDNFYSTQRKGMINGAANSLDPDGDKPSLLAGTLHILQQAVGANVCAKMDPEMSYVRLTSPQDKLGGGVRVKRLLMYDDGIDGESVLYGQNLMLLLVDGGDVFLEDTLLDFSKNNAKFNLKYSFGDEGWYSYSSKLKEKDLYEVKIVNNILGRLESITLYIDRLKGVIKVKVPHYDDEAIYI